MSDQHKLAILNSISTGSTTGIPVRCSFNTLSKSLSLTKQELDVLLLELNKQRYISQYAKKGVDSFTVVLNHKGLDAVLDKSFS